MTDHSFEGAGGDHSNNAGNTQNNSSSNNEQEQTVASKMIEHFKENRVACLLLATRILTISFTASYILPIFGTQQNAFNKALLANAATSALRLHQRLPSLTFSREFLARLLAEDSCHYLMFSLILFNVQPTLLILMPITLFAIIHAASYSLKLLDLIGQNAWWGARFLISLVEFQATNILKAIAYSEIFIMPLCILYTFMGRAGLMTPFVFYHFLVMRYSSRRNPHTRQAFAELRMGVESLSARSPIFVQRILSHGIAFVSRLAPQPQPVPPTQ